MPRESRICAHSGPLLKTMPYFALLKKQDVSKILFFLTHCQKQQNKENYQVTIHASTSYLTTQEKIPKPCLLSIFMSIFAR